MLSRIPKFFRSFYFQTAALFLVWMLFFDSNDFIKQYQMGQKLQELEDDKEFYLERIAEVQKDRTELLSNPALLEKFAREKYYMRRPSEDIFIIVEEE